MILSIVHSHVPTIKIALAVPDRVQNTSDPSSALKGFTPYENPTLGITLLYPTVWKKNESSNKTEITFFPPSEQNRYAGLKILSQDSTLTLNEYIGSEINKYKNTVSHFKLIDSVALKKNRINFTVTFNFTDPKSDTHYKQMNMYTKTGVKVYEFWYSEEIGRYPIFLPTVLKMISSLIIRGTDHGGSKPGIGVSSIPYGLDVNQNTNLVYVADSGSNQISVIDGTRDDVEANITVTHPYALAIDPDYNKLYVTNDLSNSLSVIDGTTRKLIDSIKVGMAPRSVSVDPGSQWVFTANHDDNTISVIDGVSNKQVGNITVGKGPSDLAINRVTKTLYAANSGGDTLSVVDYFTSHGGAEFVVHMTTLRVGHFPDCVAVNQETNLVYVCNGGDNTVTMINGSTEKAISNITVGNDPVAASVNPSTDKVYVANYGDDKISVISGNSDRIAKSVHVGIRPSGVAVNPVTKLVYVSNDLSNVVNVINEVTGNSTVGINFKISPPNSSNMVCNGKPILKDVFIRYDFGSVLHCKAENNAHFVFTSWSGVLAPISNHNYTTIAINASKYGDLTANFLQEPALLTIPPELLYGVILGPIVGAVTGWMLGFFRSPRRKAT